MKNTCPNTLKFGEVIVVCLATVRTSQDLGKIFADTLFGAAGRVVRNLDEFFASMTAHNENKLGRHGFILS
jgi:truncated hemoglobin YjbI